MELYRHMVRVLEVGASAQDTEDEINNLLQSMHPRAEAISITVQGTFVFILFTLGEP